MRGAAFFALFMGVAHGEPSLDPAAELVASMVDAARDGTLDASWVERHVRPGPHGWTPSTRDAWQRALHPDTPIVAALSRAFGVVHVARGEGPTRVVVQTEPLLAVTVDETAEAVITALDATTCVTCDARTRFASDLLADVRRRDSVAPRLLPGLELDLRSVSGRLAADASWPSALTAYLGSAPEVFAQLAGAVVLGRAGDVVRLRYPDGREDTWRVTWDDPNRPTVDYAALAPGSPLRLEGGAAVAWRRDATEREVRLATWLPSRRLRPDGAGWHVGRSAAAAVLDPRDDSVIVVAYEPDNGLSAVFRVGPESGALLDRSRLPRPPRAPDATDGWLGPWPTALDPFRGRLALALPDGVHVLDPSVETSCRREVPDEAAAVAFTPDGALAVATSDGRVLLNGVTQAGVVLGRPLALYAGPQGFEVVTSSGEVVHLSASGEATERARVCGGVALSAARRNRDGTWLVACGPTAHEGHALVTPWQEPVLARGRAGATLGAVAWSADGERYVVPARGGGSELWPQGAEFPEARFGRVPLGSAGFSSDGDYLLGVTLDGDVVWWHLPTVRRVHGARDEEVPRG